MSLTDEQQQLKAGAIARDKTALINRMQKAAAGLQKSLADASDVLITMQSRGYTADGTEPIVDEDLLEKQFTATELHDEMRLFMQLRNLSMGQPVESDSWAVINAKVAG